MFRLTIFTSTSLIISTQPQQTHALAIAQPTLYRSTKTLPNGVTTKPVISNTLRTNARPIGAP